MVYIYLTRKISRDCPLTLTCLQTSPYHSSGQNPVLFFRQNYSCFWCQCFYSLSKIKALFLHNKRDQITTGITSEASPTLFFRKDEKRRGLLSMEWACTHIILPCFLKVNVFRNGADDIQSLFDFFS